MAIIKLRRTPKTAFNPDRPASKLLLAQLEHLEHVVGMPPARQPRKLTEGEAARQIGALTARLLGQEPAVPSARARARKKTHSRSKKNTSAHKRSASRRRR